MRLYTFLLLLALSSQVVAINVSLDLNPTLLGIQNTAVFKINEKFDVDVVIDQVPSQLLVQSYEFDLLFNSQIFDVKEEDVIAGNFLKGEFGENAEQKLSSDKVNFSLFAFGAASHGQQGVLATVTFQIKGAGESILSLKGMGLTEMDADLNAIPITVDIINNATVNAVPLPATVAVFVPAVLSLVGFGVSQRSKS